nr:MAG TPA: hypothetical protein [Caudoviricetes sp.]
MTFSRYISTFNQVLLRYPQTLGIAGTTFTKSEYVA